MTDYTCMYILTLSCSMENLYHRVRLRDFLKNVDIPQKMWNCQIFKRAMKPREL